MPSWLRCRTAASLGDGTSRQGNSSGRLDSGPDPGRLHCCRGQVGPTGLRHVPLNCTKYHIGLVFLHKNFKILCHIKSCGTYIKD
jgi:hypothetical protein